VGVLAGDAKHELDEEEDIKAAQAIHTSGVGVGRSKFECPTIAYLEN
jgi:hypothetical protein